MVVKVISVDAMYILLKRVRIIHLILQKMNWDKWKACSVVDDFASIRGICATSIYLCIWVRACWFAVTSFSKWLPGGHIRFFGFWMAWFRQRSSSLLWNFSFEFHVHVLCGCRQKPKHCQLCRFQNGCLVILNNAQLQSTHCPLPPSPMGQGYPCRSLIYNF